MKKEKPTVQLEPVIEFKSYPTDIRGELYRGKQVVFVVPISSIMYISHSQDEIDVYSVRLRERESMIQISKNTYDNITDVLKIFSTNYFKIAYE